MKKSNMISNLRLLLCAGVAASALHACATTPSSRLLTPQALLSSTYALRGAAPVDVDEMFAAFPAWLSVEHGGAVFDSSLGAMVVTDVVFSIVAAPDARVRAERAIIWGADPSAMNAVLSGTSDKTSMVPLFDRISLEGVRSEGVQWETGSENASLRIDRFVLDGLSARSYALPSKPEAGQVVPLRHIAAIMDAFAYDGAAYSNFSFRLNNSRGDNVELRVGEGFSRGYRSGATDYQSVLGLNMLIEGMAGAPLVEISGQPDSASAERNPYTKILNKPAAEMMSDIVRRPAAFLAAATGGQTVEYQIDSTEARNVDISGALSWLARWELPPITETDLLDLGEQTAVGYRQIWNGQAVYSIDRIEVAAADFYWLIPSSYDIAYTGVDYDLGAMIADARAQMEPGMATEMSPQFDQALESLTALGLDRISGDMDMSWRWDGDNGDAALSMGGDFIDNFNNRIGIRMGGPSLAGWEAMVREETPVVMAANQFTLQNFNLSFTDNGFVDRLFAFAAAQNGGGSGADLRQSMSAMARLTGAQAEAMNSRIPGYAAAVADFLQRGGTLNVGASPAKPVGILKLQEVAQASPDTLPDVLNLSVTHTD